MTEEKEELYELIFGTKKTTKSKLKKELGWDSKKISELLDELYMDGLIDIKGSTITPVDEGLVEKTYLKRNIDMDYLKDAIDVKLVDTLLEKKFGAVPKVAIKPVVESNDAEAVVERIKNTWEGTDKKIEDIEARVNDLLSLYTKVKEIRALKLEYDMLLSEKLGKLGR